MVTFSSFFVFQIRDLHLNNAGRPLRLVYQLVEIHEQKDHSALTSALKKTPTKSRDIRMDGITVKSEFTPNGFSSDGSHIKSPTVKCETPTGEHEKEKVGGISDFILFYRSLFCAQIPLAGRACICCIQI